MNNLIKVTALKDDSGHWYVVPSELSDEFSQLLDFASEGSVTAEDDFIEKFSKYKTGGDLNLIQLYAEI